MGKIKKILAGFLILVMTVTLFPSNIISYAADTGQEQNPYGGQDYFLDASNGNDNNDGTGKDKAWKTLSMANQKEFQPGDRILLKAGEVWQDQQLRPMGSGSEGKPITIDMYGDPADGKPYIATNGKVEVPIRGTGDRDKIVEKVGLTGAISLRNQQYWEIHNMELSNDDDFNTDITSGMAVRDGIHVSINADLLEEGEDNIMDYFRISDCDIHDIDGPSTWQKIHYGGIVFQVFGEKSYRDYGTSGYYFKDVRIENNTFDRCELHAIQLAFNWFYDRDGSSGETDEAGKYHEGWEQLWVRSRDLYSRDIYIGNNYAENTGQGAIQLADAKNLVCEYNEVNGFLKRYNQVSAGLYLWAGCDSVMQFNECYDGPANEYDATPWDLEFTNFNVTYQYNYSHDNKGGWMSYMGNSSNSIARYNLSINDNGVIWKNMLSTNYSPTYVLNNVFVYDGSKLQSFHDEVLKDTVYFYNNVFYNTSQTPTNWNRKANGLDKAVFSNNAFYEASGKKSSNHPKDEHEYFGDPGFAGDPLDYDPKGIGAENIRDAAKNFRLEEDSPLIDAGKYVAACGDKDFFGTELYYGNGIDIGLQETEIGDKSDPQEQERIKAVKELETLMAERTKKEELYQMLLEPSEDVEKAKDAYEAAIAAGEKAISDKANLEKILKVKEDVGKTAETYDEKLSKDLAPVPDKSDGMVKFTNRANGGDIRYTKDGSDPTIGSLLYKEQITAYNLTYKGALFDEGKRISDVSSIKVTDSAADTSYVTFQELKDLIVQAESYKEEEYTEESWNSLASALAYAKELNGDEADIKITNAYEALEQCINALEKASEIRYKTFEDLKELIKTAQEKKKDDYRLSSWMDFQQTLKEVSKVTAEQDPSEIHAAYKKLELAIKNLKIKADDNLALNKTITANYTHPKGNYQELAADKMVDGDFTTRWACCDPDDMKDGYPIILDLDFEEEVVIEEILMDEFKDSNTELRIKTCEFQKYDEEKQEFETFKTVNDGIGSNKKINGFEPVTTSKLRVVIVDQLQGTYWTPTINELQVFGRPASEKEFNPTLDQSIAVYDQNESMRDEENNQIVVPVKLDGDLIDSIEYFGPEGNKLRELMEGEDYQAENDDYALSTKFMSSLNHGKCLIRFNTVSGAKLDFYVQVLDTTELCDLIDESENISINEEAEEGIQFRTALEDAKALLLKVNREIQAVGNDQVDLEQLGNVFNILNEKKTEYENLKVTDFSKLERKLAECEGKANNAEKYTASSWNAFMESYHYAKTIVDDKDSIQDVVDEALAALEDADANLVLRGNMALVNLGYDLVKDFVSEGFASEEEWEAYQTILQKYAAFSEKPDEEISFTEVETAVNDMLDLYKKYNKEVAGIEMLKTKLLALIQTGDSLIEDQDIYNPDAINALVPILESAKAVYESGETNISDVDSAILSLFDAIRSVIENGEKAAKNDYTMLDKALELAGELLDNKNQYRPSSIQGLKELYQEALAIKNNDTATQEEINDMTNRLTERINGVIERADVSNLKKSIEALRALTTGNLPKELAQKAETLLKNAQNMADDPEAEQSNVDEMTGKIDNLIREIEAAGDDENENGGDSGTPQDPDGNNSGNNGANGGKDTIDGNTGSGNGADKESAITSPQKAEIQKTAQTGDTSNLMLVIIILLGSAAVCTCTVIGRMKKRNK
ncbi:chitobiase/beta-hexosaminidase C-terminal domain-containing protein [Muricomes intestini]|jgi:hypothetical protein|uniref:chitobiase/beta-hexosaminidase C-terminal domain-containing protein n=1 Tax=Muricomes intestini TaxID=1796634 RepID=UPI002FDFA688